MAKGRDEKRQTRQTKKGEGFEGAVIVGGNGL